MATSKLEIIKGDDVTLNITLTDENDDPIDISSANLVFSVKNDFSDASAVISKTTASGLHTTPASGISFILLSNSQTNIPAGDYVWDIELQYGTGIKHSTKWGNLVVLPDITN